MTKEIEKKDRQVDVWSDLDRAFNELSSRVLEPFGFAGFAPTLRSDGAVFRPARTDVADTGSSYRIVAEIPGIPKEKLDIRIRGTTVEIRGEQAEEKETKGASFVHRERAYQGYYRTLELPEPVVAAEAKAKVDHGLLELELPKQHPSPGPSEVRVKVE
jgi:HSP20 family molecular chaperone IbpA